MMHRMKEITINVDGVAYKVPVPILQNPKALKPGTRLYKPSQQMQKAQPMAKRQRKS